MALQSISLDRPAHYKEMRDQWIEIVSTLIEKT
jgi:hypothetical protein